MVCGSQVLREQWWPDLEGGHGCDPWLASQVGWVWWPSSIGGMLQADQVIGQCNLGVQETGQVVGLCELVGCRCGLETWVQNCAQ